MSAGLALGVAGGVAGSFIPGVGPMLGYAIGSALGGILFAPKINQEGPRLQDLSIQSSAEGQPILKVYGTMRTAGNVIWGKPIAEKKKKKKAGGKGGGGATTTTYTYSVDFAVALNDGLISGIVKIWADGKLIYDVSPLTAAEQATVAAGGYVPNATERFRASFGKTQNLIDVGGTMRIYSGSETQLPDPLIEADLGVGNTPAFLGTAYIVFDNFALKNFGNRIPNITAEIVADGESSLQYLGAIDLAQPAITGMGQELNTSYISSEMVVTSIDYFQTAAGNAGQRQTIPADVYPSGVYTTGAYNDNGGPITVPQKRQGGAGLKSYGDRPIRVQLFDYIGGNTSVLVYLLEGSPRNLSFAGKFTPVGISSFNESAPNSVFVEGDYVYLFVYSGLYKSLLRYGEPSTDIHSGSATETPMYLEHSFSGFSIRDVFVRDGYFYLLHAAASIDQLIKFEKNSYTEISRVDIPRPHTIAALNDARLFIDAIGDAHIAYCYSAITNIYLVSVIGGTVMAYGAIPSTNTSWIVSNQRFRFAVVDGLLIISTGVNPSNNKIRYWSLTSLASSTIPLSTIVADICNSAGLTSDMINVTDLASTNVSGYLRNAQMTARSAIEPLASGFFFDGVESGDKLIFKKRGGASVATIAYDDLGAAVDGAQQDRVVTTITQDNELPIELNMQYTDPARDFQVGSQRSRRQIPKSQKIDTMQMPIAWSGTEAKQAVEKLHYMAWEEQTRHTFSLPINYLRLEPADVILLPIDGVNRRVRLTKTTLSDVIECEAASDAAANYISESVAAVSPLEPQTISTAGTTIMQLLDMPILSDQDDDAGLYIAALGTGSGWTGAVIEKSADNVVFDEVDSITTESIIGAASSILPAGITTIWDEASTVTVRLIEGALPSTTDLAAMAGANTAVIGAPGRWEVISFVTAALNADGTFTLSRLLRGRLGTEWAVGTHAVGDAFVLLEPDTLARNVPATSDIGVQKYYKATSFGGDEGGAVTYTHRAVGLKCYAPVHVRGLRHSPSMNDWTITWTRRGRVNNAWRDYVDVPLGEATESYEIDIMSGSTVKRTLTSTSQAVTYTAAMQIADFGAVRASAIAVNVYQMNAQVGRGYAGAKLIDLSIAGTLVLMHFDGSNGSTAMIDERGNTFTPTGDAKISTAQSKFGGSSLLLDGAGDYITSTAIADLPLGAGDFTIEFFIRPNVVGSGYAGILSIGSNGYTGGGIYIRRAGGTLEVIISGNPSPVVSALSAWSAGVMIHVAVTRANGTVRLFIEGALQAAATNTTNLTGTSMRVGFDIQDSGSFDGYIDELRVVKGTAVYTQSFIPPTTPFA